MQNAELLNSYNQVLRPYYAQLSLQGFDSIESLDQYLEQFGNDQALCEFLCLGFPQVKELADNLDEKNQTVLFQYLKVRLFKETLANSIATYILENFDAIQIIRLGEAVRSYAKFDINNANDYFVPSNLTLILVLALAMKAQVKVSDAVLRLPHLTKGVLVDFSSDFSTIKMLQEADTSYHHLYTFASTPHTVAYAMRNKTLRNLCAHHTVFKSIIHKDAGLRLYFDHQNNSYYKNLPPHLKRDDFILTRTLYGTIRETNADVLKFDVAPDFINFVLASDNTKGIYKNKVSLLACNNYNSQNDLNSTNYNLQNAFKDCQELARLVKHMLSLKVSYQVELQFEANYIDRLQLLFTVKGE